MRRRIAFAIATAGDPELRLVIVKDGDLLDAESLEGIRDIAARRGYTALIERDRDESRQIGFTIVDGALGGAACTLDMGPIQGEARLAQARRESERADPMAARVGTKLFRDGTGRASGDGAQYVPREPRRVRRCHRLATPRRHESGYLPARWLRPGDRVVVAEIEGVVVDREVREAFQTVHFTVRTDRGAQIVFERSTEFLVRVLTVGAPS